MRNATVLVLCGTALLLAPVLAEAQSPAALPSATRAQAPRFAQRFEQRTVPPLTTILGVPVGVDAPVAPPYCDCAYRDFAGQPMTGNDSVLTQAIGRQE